MKLKREMLPRQPAKIFLFCFVLFQFSFISRNENVYNGLISVNYNNPD